MSINGIQFNWVDFIFIGVFTFFVYEGIKHGFWIMLADFISFLLAITVSLRLYPLVSSLLIKVFPLTTSVANALGFIVLAIILELGLGYVFGHLVMHLPKKVKNIPFDKYLSVIPASLEALLLVAFTVIIIVGLPISAELKQDFVQSSFGGVIVSKVKVWNGRTSEIFGGVAEKSITYLTIDPNSTKTIALTMDPVDLQVDEQSEEEIFNLINEERREKGIKELIWDEEVAQVARGHGYDMWMRKYFGHISLEGKDVGDRLDTKSIDYFIAGENLAMAPSSETAHTGLMNSEGHRLNILEEGFEKAGIGVVSNGVYGKMFVEVFVK
jgi:uncharacterized protein YkwD